MGWVWRGYGLSISWPSAGYGLDIGIGPKSIDWSWPKVNTLEDIVIYYVPKSNMAAINTMDYYVHAFF